MPIVGGWELGSESRRLPAWAVIGEGVARAPAFKRGLLVGDPRRRQASSHAWWSVSRTPQDLAHQVEAQ